MVVATSLVVVNIDLLSKLAGPSNELPGEVMTLLSLRFGAALVLLVGVILVLMRTVAGVFFLVAGALAAAAAVLLYPVIMSDFFPSGLGFGDYVETLFRFEGIQPTFSAIALVASPLALLVAVLPATRRYPRGRSGAGWPGEHWQQPGYGQPDYPAPSQDYFTPQGHPQQGNPPQGHGAQGYPRQPGW